jgi:hypothetical protein
VSSNSIVKGIIDDIINTAVKTAEVDKQKTKYLQHFINKYTVQVRSEFGKFAYTAICMRNVYTLIRSLSGALQMKHGFTTMTRKQSNNQVNGKMSTLLGQKKQN